VATPAQLVEQGLLQRLEHARLAPLPETAPARDATHAEDFRRQLLPGDAAAQHEENAAQARAVIRRWPPAVRARRMRGQERLHPAPQGVGDEFAGHALKLATTSADG
jgi:hypothetical protein